MALKIEPVDQSELDAEFGTDAQGNDPETVKFIAELGIGGGFRVTPEGTETERQVKRRINACARQAFRELDWHAKEGSKTLTARVKAIDTNAQKKAEEEAIADAKAKAEKEEADAKAKADADAAEKAAKDGAAEKQPVAAGTANGSRQKVQA